MKVFSTLAGALIGPFVGYFVTWLLYSVVGSRSSCMWYFEALAWSLFLGAPVGLVTFGVTGYRVGKALEKAEDDIAVRNEELKMLAERGGVLKVRVELRSFLNHDAIRGELERAGLAGIDERTRFEKFFSSGSVKCVTGTIDSARIEELAALSFVKSVRGEGSMDGRTG